MAELADDSSLTRITLTSQVQPIYKAIEPYIIATCAVSNEDVAEPHLYQAQLTIDEVDGKKLDPSQPNRGNRILKGDTTVPLAAAYAGKLWFVFDGVVFRSAANGHKYRFAIKIRKGEYSATENTWKRPYLHAQTMTRRFSVVSHGQSAKRDVSDGEHEWDMDVVKGVLNIRHREPPLCASTCLDMWMGPPPVVNPVFESSTWAATWHSWKSALFTKGSDR
ncbi:hypothetical protein O9K51_05919 [Purpureocillium lavendulum]|uniref:Uncharacterized protein n=1 Tax=Purpureocillium lavendulum TaxID=1247861 RepID=A0AB34FVG0_9HYPO|nr:hypothetical protein O9K51_05919 [Purpureocillium lavendulum]